MQLYTNGIGVVTRPADYTPICSPYTREEEPKTDDLKGMSFYGNLANYWWKSLNILFSEQVSPDLPLLEKDVWIFQHGGIRPWTGKNFHKINGILC